MRTILFAALAAVALAGGCASVPLNDELAVQPQVSGVKLELGGMDEKALKSLCAQYISRGKVFLYAEQDTNTPITDKKDIVFALQFKTAPVPSRASNQALFFNKRMLEYMHKALSRRSCPEHRGIAMLEVPAVYGLRTAGEEKLERRGKLVIGPRKPPGSAPATGLVCPVDGRKFIPF